MPPYRCANLNRAQERVGPARKPSSRPYTCALPRLRSNGQMDAAGRMDGPGATIARSDAVQRFSRCALECFHLGMTGTRSARQSTVRVSKKLAHFERLLGPARGCD